MSALFRDVHNTTNPKASVKLKDFIGGKRAAMLAAYQCHTSGDVADTTDTGDVIPPWAFDGEEDMTFDPWR